MSFQYPQADRRGCNLFTQTSLMSRMSEFQYPQADRRGCNRNSIPPRLMSKPTFQYPQADRRGCNCRNANTIFYNFSAFQYPQADRRGCNYTYVEDGDAVYVCFSIHKRIEGGATQGNTLGRAYISSFQYPQADRRGCNWCEFHSPCRKLSVSVSTSGSKGVQRTLYADPILHQSCFSIHKRIEGGATPQGGAAKIKIHKVSVSTSGSKGVQPP